jgi:hypothetical protein
VPAGGEPMTVGPDGRAHLLPMEMPYDSDAGVPPGYKIVEKRRYKLAITGASIVGGLWIASCIAGGFIEQDGKYSGKHGWPLCIPVVGPLIGIASSKSDVSGTTALVLDGVAQLSGLAMFITGMAMTEKRLVYQFPNAGLTVQPVASPLQNGGFAGLTGTF